MSGAVQDIERIEALAGSGLHAQVAAELEARPSAEVEASPALALMLGTAQARLGRHAEGLPWIERALDQARRTGESEVERRALNARGAVAFVTGRLDEAADSFTRALMAASRDGDLVAVGRSSNNVGSISSLRGRHAEAIASYTMACAAFDRAGARQGVAECRHNLGIAFGQQGDLARALAQADHAVREAEAAGDRNLAATARRGRAELRTRLEDVGAARADVMEALATHRALGDAVQEAEDNRILAAVLVAEGRLADAERLLRGVVECADACERPQLGAEARRDLAFLVLRAGPAEEARTLARAARAMFVRLGADDELRQLAAHDWDEDFAAELHRTLQPLEEAQRLADTGRYADLLAHLAERHSAAELEQSPTLALLYGIAHARLGQLELGRQWATIALTRARMRGDRPVEVRALNVCGAIALEQGGIGEATHFFTRAQEEALQDGDLGTVGRCANNLGIIANLQGDHGRAIGSFTMAIAAYQRAAAPRGVAESHHNLGIAYREQGALDAALQAADDAVREAADLGDQALWAQALAGRAEVRVARQDGVLAVREAERALETHRALGDHVRETEDLRILAIALDAVGQPERAEAQLREVIQRAGEHGRPLLVATAQRDLAGVLQGAGEWPEAQEVARAARAAFVRLGAASDVAKLDRLLAQEADHA